MLYKKQVKLSMLMTAVLTIAISTSAFASSTYTRLSGVNRYETSSKIALDGWTQSDYAVLALGEDYPDALCAAPLAGKYKAPILLTETNSIPASTLATIQQLQVKNIFIVGGTGVISEAVQDKLTALGITITRLAGQTRYETDIAVAKQLGTVSQIAVVTGEDYADALSIAPIAVKLNMPIILVGQNSIPQEVKDYVASQSITTTYVIGKGTSINKVTGLPNVTEINGADKYARNIAIISAFKSSLNFGTIYLATGENFADALSGSVLAGLNGNPLILVGSDITNEENLLQLVAPDATIKILGGTGAVPDSTAIDIGNPTTVTTPSAITTIPVTTSSIPTGVQATLDSTGIATIQWNTVANANSYNVYYSTDNVSYTLAGTTAGNEYLINLNSISTLVGITNTPIYFEVAAVTNGTQSALSAYISLVPASTTQGVTTGDVDTTTTDGDINTTIGTSNNGTSNAPANVTARMDKNGLITIRWDKVADAEHYNIYVSYGDSNYTIVHRTRGNKVQFKVDFDKVLKALRQGDSISFVVRTVSNSSESVNSSPIQITTPDSLQDSQGTYNKNKGYSNNGYHNSNDGNGYHNNNYGY